MTLRIPAKVLLHVWSYDFYDMTLSTGKQRRHMINKAYSNKLLAKILNLGCNDFTNISQKLSSQEYFQIYTVFLPQTF